MKLDIISYSDILALGSNRSKALELDSILRNKGIMGVSEVPYFLERSDAYIKAVRAFSALPEEVKSRYAPDRDAGFTEGYELGAEWFKNEAGEWQIDDKKASFYAHIPDRACNIWPKEIDLKTPYQELGELMRHTGSLLLSALGITQTLGFKTDEWFGYGRMLHYQKVGSTTDSSTTWCGAHLDHGAFTSLLPARYFRNGVQIDEPEEAGLHVIPSGESQFSKVNATDHGVMLFQVGEFSQLASNDRIMATKHLVRKARGDIERFAFACFIDPPAETRVKSNSVLAQDSRFAASKAADETTSYQDWAAASYERYRALIASKASA